MLNKFFLFLSIFNLTCTVSAQKLNLRKAILNSDFIIVSDDFEYKKAAENDYSTQNYIVINKIDTILRNNLSSIPKKLKLRSFEDGEDFYSNLLTNDGGCVLKAQFANDITNYYHIFFIKKVGKEYQVFLFLNGIEWEQYQNYKNQIKTIAPLEEIKDQKVRFDKTLEWFIDNGLIPDNNFIEYYKEKKITTDTIQYSEKQYEKALLKFEKGEEALLPIVKDKFKDKVKEYFVKKLEEIIEKSKLEYNDYYEFYETVRKATDGFGDNSYDSMDYLLNNNITTDKFDEYEKKNIMTHLLEVVKNWH
jgi:hypothetical protein